MNFTSAKQCLLLTPIWFLVAASVSGNKTDLKKEMIREAARESNQSVQELALLGGGCFWCTEAVFEKTKGVLEAVSGYAGGWTKNPTYKEICTGSTGHAEVIRIKFDKSMISFSELLEVFAEAHDPTTLNRQGADVGTQYRSTIMYYSESQREAAVSWKAKLGDRLENPVVTEIVPAPKFHPAEEYHQDYFSKNPTQGYCNFVILPKLRKLGLE